MQGLNKKSMIATSMDSLGYFPSHSSFVASTRRPAVYTAILNCSRRRKRGRPDDFMEGRIPPGANIKRWDGGAKACAAWDSLRRDPELWFDDGNCLVHLYGKGQSRRGPAFRVPLSSLLEANLHRLLSRYLWRNVSESVNPGSYGNLQSDREVVDLYIPPPPMAGRKQILDFYLAMRNLFAWACKRSLVGEHLGSALITLLHSMREFRSPDVDNIEDVKGYLEHERYLDMANQPIHALAVVHLAEYYQLRNLYINAFAHCAGMGDCLYGLPEYQEITSITRKLLRRAQTSVEAKLSSAAASLRSFLEDDLSESNIGLTAGGRAHLERFRTFLLAFYAHRLGYYPPSPVDTRNGMWDPEVYRVMRADFAALYEFLVDRTFTVADSASIRGQGGICVLQSVHAFDVRHRYRPLLHPLPRLPEVATRTAHKRMSWFGKADNKLRPDQRLIAHAALVKATNGDAPHLARNPLVAAYKVFEEDSLCSQLKFDKIEKLSQADARKIRWLLIYGVYQTLRSCTDAPPEVTATEAVGYSLAIPTADLPPWKEERRPLLPRTGSAKSPVPSVPLSGASTPSMSSAIRPDIDYFALAHRDAMPPFDIPPRGKSLRRVLSRTGSLRRSVGSPRRESRAAVPAIETPAPQGNAMEQEATVHDYANATDEAHDGNGESDSSMMLRPGALATRSPSTSSSSSAGSSGNTSVASPRSEGSWSTAHTSILDTSPEGLEKTLGGHEGAAISECSTPDEPSCPPPVPPRNSKRMSRAVLSDQYAVDVPAPLQIRKECRPTLSLDDKVSERCKAVSARRLGWDSIGDGEIPEWDLFKDVGGLTALA